MRLSIRGGIILNQNRIQLSPHCYVDLRLGDLIKNEFRISLSKRQFLLLNRLAQDLGKPVANEILMQDVWGGVGMLEKDALYVCVKRLRSHLKPDSDHLLRSIKGYGYMLCDANDISPREHEHHSITR